MCFLNWEKDIIKINYWGKKGVQELWDLNILISNDENFSENVCENISFFKIYDFNSVINLKIIVKDIDDIDSEIVNLESRNYPIFIDFQFEFDLLRSIKGKYLKF
jgi:hypothetical protein